MMNENWRFRNELTVGSYKTPNSRAYFVDTWNLDLTNPHSLHEAFEEMDKALTNRRILNESVPCWKRS